jgi:Tfp pilus assembly protein PilV
MKHIIPLQKNTGFTLIEALVAVFIFSSAVVFLITIAGRGLLAMNSAQNQTTAYFLAQEGIEIVHNLRNEAFLMGDPSWLDRISPGYPQCMNGDACGFHIDFSNQMSSGVPCASLNGCALETSTSNPPKFSHSTGEKTPFKREVFIRPNGNNWILVRSVVSWGQGSFTRQVVLDEILREWVTSSGQQAQSLTPLAPASTQGSLQTQTP